MTNIITNVALVALEAVAVGVLLAVFIFWLAVVS